MYQLNPLRLGERKMLERPFSGITLTLLLIGMLTLAFNVEPTAAAGQVWPGWDVFYSADKLPDDPTLDYPWTLNENFVEDIGVASVSDGILKLNTTSETHGWDYTRNWNANNSVGWIVEARVKIEAHDLLSQGLDFIDGSKWTDVEFETDRIEILISDEWTSIDVDNTFFRTYRIRLKGSDFKIYLDNALIFEGEATRTAAQNKIRFGKGWTGDNYGGISHWDYVAYETIPQVHNIDTGLDYAMIQEAIDAPETLDGHTIQVDIGAYFENVVVDKSLSLIGADRFNTIIDGSSDGTVLKVTADNVNVSGFTVQKSGGRLLDWFGIYVGKWNTGNNISYNIITNNGMGIWLEKSSNNTISGNNITGNIVYGVMLYESYNNTLSGNVINGNRYNIDVVGSELSQFIHSIDISNLVDGTPVQYLVNQKDLTINPAIYPKIGYLALINCTNITVEDLTLKNNAQGLLLANINSSRITNNNITNNDYGILLWGSSNNNTISGNNITANNQGVVLLYGSSNNRISGNNITANTGIGIHILGSSSNNISENDIENNSNGIMLINSSDNNSISENDITNNRDGISLVNASDNTISRNNITANTQGVVLGSLVRGYGSSNNEISRNNIANNSDGIVLRDSSNNNTLSENDIVNNEYGIKFAASSNNSVYHNNFIGNTKQIFDLSWDEPLLPSSANFWDDGCEGNYWSDQDHGDCADHYRGPNQDEPGSDRIVDTPYVIDEDNRDNYPLMGRWYISEDINNDGVVNILDISTVARAFGSYPGHERWNCRADINRDQRVNIIDIFAVAKKYGWAA